MYEYVERRRVPGARIVRSDKQAYTYLHCAKHADIRLNVIHSLYMLHFSG